MNPTVEPDSPPPLVPGATAGVVPTRFAAGGRGNSGALGWLWIGLLAIVLTFLVVYPIGMLLIGAFTSTNPVAEGYRLSDLSISNFATVAANENVYASLLNSMAICGGGTALAMLIGLTFAWIVVRTDTPWKALIAGAGMLPLFVPPLVAGVAWAILGSPRTGLLNTALASIGLDWRVNFYSLPGMVLVFGIYYAPYVYMFTSAALRNMDPSLEEAAEISGASSLATMMTVTFPLILPAILSSMLLSFVVMLGIYGIPAALGTPANISMLTTYIFALTIWSPPLYNTAAATATILMVVTAILVFAQQKVLRGRSFTTVAGKSFRPRTLRLGPWRFLTLGLAMLYIVVVVGLPSVALLIAGFRKFMFVRTLGALFDAKAYSLFHFEQLFGNPLTLDSIVNSLEVGIITAVCGGVLSFAVGYTVTRTRLRGRPLIDLIATAPVGVPGLVVGVAYLWAWIGLPGGLYGSIWILALAFVARFIPDTVKALSSSLMQIHPELEEASWLCGRGLFGTVISIVLPLARPGVIAAMTLLFTLSIRELGSSLFLYSSHTMVMSVHLLNYFEGGNLGVTAAFSIVQMVLLAGLLTGANWLTRSRVRVPAANRP
jgi:iron(III) transport system permease protein